MWVHSSYCVRTVVVMNFRLVRQPPQTLPLPCHSRPGSAQRFSSRASERRAAPCKRPVAVAATPSTICCTRACCQTAGQSSRRAMRATPGAARARTLARPCATAARTSTTARGTAPHCRSDALLSARSRGGARRIAARLRWGRWRSGRIARGRWRTDRDGALRAQCICSVHFNCSSRTTRPRRPRRPQ